MIIHIIRQVEFEKMYINGLKLELDYELAWLSEYIRHNDEENINNSKIRLEEIYLELSAYGAI